MTMQPELNQSPRPNAALPMIAGILIIVSEGFKLLILVMVFLAGFFVSIPAAINGWGPVILFPLVILPVLAITALSVAGGILALQRRRWPIALTGAIIAALPFSLLGIAAVVLLALSRDEFVS